MYVAFWEYTVSRVSFAPCLFRLLVHSHGLKFVQILKFIKKKKIIIFLINKEFEKNIWISLEMGQKVQKKKTGVNIYPCKQYSTMQNRIDKTRLFLFFIQQLFFHITLKKNFFFTFYWHNVKIFDFYLFCKKIFFLFHKSYF